MKLYDNKIHMYMLDSQLDIEKIIKDYTNYIYTIIRNSYSNLSNEDIEEIILDVFMTLWKNQFKLDINKSMAAYISGITKNLIKYKKRQIKNINDNIEDFEDKIMDITNIELVVMQNEREKIISNELEKLKQEDKEIFIEYYYSQKSIKEISIIFNMSESKVKSKLFRTRKKLQKILKKRGYNYDK